MFTLEGIAVDDTVLHIEDETRWIVTELRPSKRSAIVRPETGNGRREIKTIALQMIHRPSEERPKVAFPNLENLIIRGNAGEKLKGILNTGYQDVAGWRNDALVRNHRAGMAGAGVAGVSFMQDAIQEAAEADRKKAIARLDTVKVEDGRCVINGKEVLLDFKTIEPINFDGMIPPSILPTFELPENTVMAFDFAGITHYAGVDDGWRPAIRRPEAKTLTAEFKLSTLGREAIAHALGVPISVISPSTTTRKGKSAMATRKTLQNLIDQASERLANLDRFPKEEDFPVGTLIGFDARFEPNGKVYHYAGVKTPKGWVITGRESHRFFTWDALIQFLAEEMECLALVVTETVVELIEPTVLDDDTAYGESDTPEA